MCEEGEGWCVCDEVEKGECVRRERDGVCVMRWRRESV